MTKTFEKFLRTEDGAAVVDMTMLMAALVGLALAVSTTVSNGMGDLSNDLSTTLVNENVDPAF